MERHGCVTVPTPELLVNADAGDCPKWPPHEDSQEEPGPEGVAYLRIYATPWRDHIPKEHLHFRGITFR
jgi:hypothetical protein